MTRNVLVGAPPPPPAAFPRPPADGPGPAPVPVRGLGAGAQPLGQAVDGTELAERAQVGETERADVALGLVAQAPRRGEVAGIRRGQRAHEVHPPALRRRGDGQLGGQVADDAAPGLEHERGEAQLVGVHGGALARPGEVHVGQVELTECAEAGGDVAQEGQAEQVVGLAEGGVLGGRDPPQRRLEIVAPHRHQGPPPRRGGGEARVGLHVTELGDALEARLGERDAVGVDQHEAVGEQHPRVLGLGDVARAEHHVHLRQRLVVAPERHQRTGGQVAPAHPGLGVLPADLPRPDRHAVVLGGTLQVVAAVAHPRRLGEHRLGPGVGPLLAGTEIAQRLLRSLARLVEAAVGDQAMGVLHEHPPLQRRLGVRHQLHRPVEVAAGHVETTEQRQRGRAQQQQRRLLLGHRAEAGEHAEQRARLDRVGDRLGQGGHHRGCPLVGPGVEQQSDRLDVPLAVDELAGEAQCRGRFDLDRAERRLVEQVDRAVDAAPQRYPGGHDAFDETRAAELVEEALVEPRRTGEHADQAPVTAAQAVQRGRRGGALHADDVGQGVATATVALVLLERGDDHLHRTVGGIDDPLRLSERALRQGLDHLGAGDRQGRGVEAGGIDEVTDLPQLAGEEAAGDDHPSILGDVLDPVGEAFHVARRQQVGVVDRHGRAARRSPGRGRGRRCHRAGAACRAARPGAAATTCRSRSGPRGDGRPMSARRATW